MLTFLLALVGAFGAEPSATPSTLPPGHSWQLVWHDEFEGTAVDESKWERINGPRRDAFWDKDDAYLDGQGCLILRTRNDGGRYSSGAVRTKGRFEHRYGYWECRCKFPKQEGHWPAFWMMPAQGLKDAEAGGMAGAEIDIMEKAWLMEKINHAIHWDGYGKHHKSEAKQVEWPGLNEGFHTFAVHWTPEEYVFYIDGKESWRTKAGGPSQALSYAKLTEEIGPWAGDITKATLPDSFVVDYVRVYDEIPAILQDVHRIVFLGDSITQAGDYVTDIACWLASKGVDAEVLNLGLGSETASDLTEAENEGHKKAFGFGRPPVSERLDRALAATKPDLLFACYGMNDAGSLPSDESGMNRYKAAITHLRDAALAAGVKRVVLCTPPVHDVKDAAPQQGPDADLARFSAWLLSKKTDGWDVVDIHGPMRKALDEGRAKDPAFVLAKDGVHPGREGHWIMARCILEQCFGANLEGIASSEQLFAKNGAEIRDLIRQRQSILFAAWMTKIGHTRPGVAGGPGVPPRPSVEDAEAKAKKITTEVSKLIP